MFILEIDELETKAPALRHEGDWPFLRPAFEAGLRDRTIQGVHCPRRLPDDVSGYRSAAERPRRHRLRYRWNRRLPILGVISCNPSGATRRMLDDTLELTVNQAALWGFGGIDQGNLDPVFETNSKTMHLTADFADPLNRRALEAILRNTSVWLAWGNKPGCLTGVNELKWRQAEQHVLAAGHERQSEGTKFVVTKLNKPRPNRAPAHASPRRFPKTAPPVLHIESTPVRIVER